MGIFRLGRIALALAAPLLLAGCLLTPGKFVSTLSVNADRSFAFAYKGEVIALDPGEEMSKGLNSGSDESGSEDDPAAEESSFFTPIAWQESPDDAAEAAQKKAETERKRREIAETLRKEAGYRSVEYLGDGKFMIDYAISGTLDHNFVYPYNLDAEIIFPFIAIEMRAGGNIRVKAPAFGNEKSMGDTGMGDSADAAKNLDGTFTLDTDAEIVSQNNEDGVQTVNGRKTIVWEATPLSKAAPVAVLKMAK